MKNKNKLFSSLAIIILFVIAGFIIINRSVDLNPNSKQEVLARIQKREQDNFEQAKNIKYVMIAGQKIKVDLATTEEARQQGLSGRTDLKDGEGLLFIFEHSGNYPFWMKDMNFPIDMIWIDAGFNMVTYIKKDAKPESYPEAFGPSAEDGSSQYVLEVPTGFSDKYNLKVGDRVGFLAEDSSPVNN